MNEYLNSKIKELGNVYLGYMPAQAITRIMKPKPELVS
jgi:hypothetical protein